MATLRNLTDASQFNPQLHVMVPAFGSVEVDDADAGLVNTASGVWAVDAKGDPEERSATRRTVTRGARRAEVDAAPVMETRG